MISRGSYDFRSTEYLEEPVRGIMKYSVKDDQFYLLVPLLFSLLSLFSYSKAFTFAPACN